VNGRTHKVTVRASHSTGKCLGVNEIITLADGRRVKAGELPSMKDFTLITLVGGKPTPVAAIADWNGVEPVWKITTESGRSVTRTGKHPLWAADAVFQTARAPKIDSLEWTNAEDIRVGHVLAVTKELPAFGDKATLSDSEIKILAYIIGDGGVVKIGTLRFGHLGLRLEFLLHGFPLLGLVRHS
jgi:intein/homing endonuclease